MTMLYKKQNITVREFRDEMYHKTDCLPVGQRLPVYSKDNAKDIGIVETMKDGFDIGTITVMKLNRKERRAASTVKFEFESIDGGHRKRSLWGYLNDKFMVQDKYFSQLSNDEKESFLDIPLSFTVYNELNSATKGHIFRTLNKTTDVNFIEKLNSYGDTPIANFVRETVRVVKQIDNECHELFYYSYNKKNEPQYKYLSFDNDRLKQDHAFARIVYRYINALKNKEEPLLGGSSDKSLGEMYEDDTLTVNDIKRVEPKIKKHLDFLRKMGYNRSVTFRNGLTQHDFKALSYLWFYLVDTYGSFEIQDAEEFFEKYAQANKKITNMDGVYARKVHEESGYTYTVMYKKYISAPQDGKKIKSALACLVREMGDIEDLIETRDPRRDFSEQEKEAKLAEQGFRCAIDNKKLVWKDAHAAHVTAHADGGRTVYSNLKMVRARYNKESGTMNLDEYKAAIA